ncbi:MAG: PAS domain S-box protein, partial [Euryarchaeota archaeon]|nr:PAS domain S-box protein [Euryarchaeota archaeon]
QSIKVLEERKERLTEAVEQLQQEIADRVLAEEALRESEERFRALFENSRDAVYITWRDGRFIDFNDSMLELFGYTREEMKNLDALTIYVDPDDRRRLQEEIEEKGSVRDYEIKFKKKDGTTMDCLVTSSLWRDEDGTVMGYQGVIRDITEKKKSEEALRRSKEFVETVLNSMHDAVSIIDARDFRVVGVNKAFLDQLGLKEEEAIGRLCHELTHRRRDPCHPPDDVCPLMETLETGKHASVEHIHYQKDGEKVYVEVSTSPIKDERGRVVQVVHVARDVTERKKAEEQIRESLRVKEVLLREIHHRVKNNAGHIEPTEPPVQVRHRRGAQGHVQGEPEPDKVHGPRPRAPLPVRGPGQDRFR